MRYVPPNPENGTEADLLQAMKAAPRQLYYVRLMALRLLLLGLAPTEVAPALGRTLRTLRRWVHLWNQGGLEALLPQPRPGRPRILKSADQQRLKHLVQHPKAVGQDHWTGAKLHGYISQQWSVEMGYSTLLRNLHEQGFRLKIPRPWPVDQDEVQREAFRGLLTQLLEDPAVEIFFLDETGILGDPRPRRRWILKGEKETVPFTGIHLRVSVAGAVNPQTGELVALLMSGLDSDMFQIFLDELAQETKGRNIVVVLDNASWHKVKRLHWHHLKPLYLPAYSPDLNPIERLWQVLKARYFSDWIARRQEELEDRVAQGLVSFMDDPQSVASICQT